VDKETWTQVGQIFLTAPLTIVAFTCAVSSAVWFAQRVFTEGERRGMKSQMQAMEERIKLAKEREEIVRLKLEGAQNRATELSRQIGNTEEASLASNSASVRQAISDASKANSELKQIITDITPATIHMSQRLVSWMFVRLTLFAIVVAVAMFPTLVDYRSSTLPFNNAGFIKGLFAPIVPAAALAMLSTLDFLHLELRKMNATTSALLAVATVYICLSICSVLVAYLSLPQPNVLLSPDSTRTFVLLSATGLIPNLIVFASVSFARTRSG